MKRLFVTAGVLGLLPLCRASLLAGPERDFFDDLNRSLAEIRTAKESPAVGLGRLPKMALLLLPRSNSTVYEQLQLTLNQSHQRPLAVVWDYYFLKAEGRPFSKLSDAFAASPVPLVLGTELRSRPHDEQVYADGPRRFRGNVAGLYGPRGRSSPVEPVNPVADYIDPDSLAVAVSAAVLSVKRGLTKEEALGQAREIARRVAEVMPSQPAPNRINIKGIYLVSRPVEQIPAGEVIAKNPRALKKLKNAVVMVCDSEDDIGPVFSDAGPIPLCHIHAWTILQILGSRLK